MKSPNSVTFYLKKTSKRAQKILFLYDTVIEIFKNFGVRTVASVLALFLCRILGVMCEGFIIPALSYEPGKALLMTAEFYCSPLF